MDTKTVSLTSLLILAGMGNVYFVWQGTTYRAAIAQAPSGAVQLTGSGAAPFIAKAVDAGAGGQIECKRNAVQRPDGTLVALVYCADGKTAGFFIGNALALALLNEVKAKISGITADEVRLLVDENNKLWATKIEKREPE